MQAEIQSRTLTMPSLRRALRNEAFRAPDIWWFLALVPPPICSLPLGSKTSKNSFFFYPIPITYPASRKESKLIVLTMAASCGTLRTKSGAFETRLHTVKTSYTLTDTTWNMDGTEDKSPVSVEIYGVSR